MKMIMFYAPEFWWRPHARALEEAPEAGPESRVEGAVVVFYQVEAEDPPREKKVVEKMVKNVKWLARKWASERVVLHSFNHLSTSKAPPREGQEIVRRVRERLERAGFEVHETPFGWLNEWRMHVAGESLAKVFKDL